MGKNIALLRGINVGGKKRILMKDLKQLTEAIGFTNVKTYIQSGNILFHGPLESAASKIGSAIKRHYDFEVSVLVKTQEDFEAIISEQPFRDNAINSLYLTFLSDEPTEELYVPENTEDTFEIINSTAYIKCEGKYHKSKLNNSFFEKKLKTQATTRSWKTVLKIGEMLYE